MTAQVRRRPSIVPNSGLFGYHQPQFEKSSGDIGFVVSNGNKGESTMVKLFPAAGLSAWVILALSSSSVIADNCDSALAKANSLLLGVKISANEHRAAAAAFSSARSAFRSAKRNLERNNCDFENKGTSACRAYLANYQSELGKYQSAQTQLNKKAAAQTLPLAAYQKAQANATAICGTALTGDAVKKALDKKDALIDVGVSIGKKIGLGGNCPHLPGWHLWPGSTCSGTSTAPHTGSGNSATQGTPDPHAGKTPATSSGGHVKN